VLPHGTVLLSQRIQMGCNRHYPLVTALIALATFVLLSASAADARVNGSGTVGRGLRSLLPAPMMRMTLRPARALEHARKKSGQPVNRPGASTTAKVTHRPGLIGGLVAGFLGAGFLGLLFGNGFFAGLGGIASLVGLVLQIALFAFVGWLAWGWWHRRASPAFAGLSPRQLADAYDRPRNENAERMPAGGGLQIGKSDYDAFERLLSEILTAFGREDIAALRLRMTPEMLPNFSDDLDRNARRGLVNEISDVKLLQGDLADVWRDEGRNYATVAMRFSLIDRMVERGSERVVDGGLDEVTELWTFVQAPGGDWLLSAIEKV
jgi:predicted lipid-binding transport protein (Tim44 family)